MRSTASRVFISSAPVPRAKVRPAPDSSRRYHAPRTGVVATQNDRGLRGWSFRLQEVAQDVVADGGEDGLRGGLHALERVGEAAEDAGAVVVDHAGLAVHDLAGAGDGTAERLADRLVAEADAEDGELAREVLDEGHADAGLFRRAGPGGDDDPLRRHLLDLLQRHLVVPHDQYLRAPLGEVLVEVV